MIIKKKRKKKKHFYPASNNKIYNEPYRYDPISRIIFLFYKITWKFHKYGEIWIFTRNFQDFKSPFLK